MGIIFKSITAGLSSVAYALYYNVPKKAMYGNFISGLLGVLTYNFFLNIIESKFVVLLISSITIGIVAEIMSRIFKLPATVYLVPGLIPLVPGLTMFKTMQDLAIQDYTSLLEHGSDLVLSATALGLGVVISSMFSKTIQKYKAYITKNIEMKKENRK